MIVWRHTVTVIGRGEFPLDMLRYDGLAPAREIDSYEVRRTFHVDCGADGEPIELTKWGARDWEPQDARWLSFGWRVHTHRKERVG